MDESKGISNVETDVGAEDGLAIVTALMERVAFIQEQIDELIGMHRGPTYALGPRIEAEVWRLVEQRLQEEFSLERSQERYLHGPVHYLVEFCYDCEALHWVPAPTHDDDDIKCTCTLCGEPMRMPETAHERMRAARATQSSEASLPFAYYWGDRLDLDSRSLISSISSD